MSKTTNIAQRQQFAERLKSLREKLAIRPSALAKSAKVTAATVWHWEHAGAIPREQTLNKLAAVLGTSTSYLRGETHQAQSTSRAAPARDLNDASLEDLISAITTRGFHVRITSE